MPEWSNLGSLQSLSLSHNLLKGTLPAAWSNLTSLTTLFLSSNELEGKLRKFDIGHVLFKQPEALESPSEATVPCSAGTLQPSWSSLAALTTLQLGQNMLSGSLPGIWGILPLGNLSLKDNLLSGQLMASAPRHAAYLAAVHFLCTLQELLTALCTHDLT